MGYFCFPNTGLDDLMGDFVDQAEHQDGPGGLRGMVNEKFQSCHSLTSIFWDILHEIRSQRILRAFWRRDALR